MSIIRFNLTNSKGEKNYSKVLFPGFSFIDNNDGSRLDFTSEDYEVLRPIISFDDKTVDPEKKDFRLLEINIESKGVVNVTAVFCFPYAERIADNSKKIQDALLALKPLPTNTEDEKKAKLNALLKTLKDLQVLYVICDLNNKENEKNKVFIVSSSLLVESYPFLVVTKVADEIKENKKPAPEIQKKDALFVTPKLLLHEQRMDFVFVAVFALIGFFGISYSVSLFFKTQTLAAVFSLVLGIFCLAMNASVSYSNYSDDIATKGNNEYMECFLMCLVNLVASMVGLGAMYLLSKTSSTADSLGNTDIVLGVGMLMIVILVFVPLVSKLVRYLVKKSR